MSKLIIPKTTTSYRETAVPKAADLLFDTDINKMVIGDGMTPGGIVIDVSGGTASSEVTGGFGINVVDNEVSLKRYDSIENLVSGGTVQAGHAYKLNATSASGTTIYAEWFANGTFARDPAHIEIMVNGVGYLHLGQNTTAGSETAPFVLVGALEPDAMNNVTVRFHDGTAVMTVEDHIGGYVVISASGSTAGTLVYALTNTGDDASPYITFSSELNGTPIDLAGTTVTTERHVVGNGYEETILGGTINVIGSTASLTLAALGLNNTVVSSGTLTLGDVYIPNGATVAVSGGGLAVEKVTGAGSESVIDLGGTTYINGTNAFFENVTITSGYQQNYGAGIAVESGPCTALGCTITSCTGRRGALTTQTNAMTVISSSTITGNVGQWFAGGITVAHNSSGKLIIKDSIVSGNTGTSAADIYQVGYDVVLSGSTVGEHMCALPNNAGAVYLVGNNKIGKLIAKDASNGCSAIISSGASINLTSSIAPGGGIAVLTGGCTVNGVTVEPGTYTSIVSSGGSAVINQ